MKNQAASVRRCTRLEKVARAAFTALVLGSVALASSSAPWSTLAAQGRTTQAGGAQPGTAQEDPESGAETEKPADTATESEPSVTPKPDGPVVLVETLGGLKTLDPASLRSAKVDTEEGTIQLGTSTFRIDELLFIGFGPTPAAAEPRSLAPARFRLRGPGDVLWGTILPGAGDAEDDTVRISSAVLTSTGSDASTGRPGTMSLPVGALAVVSFRAASRDLLVLSALETKLMEAPAADDDVVHLTRGEPLRGYLEELAPTELVFGAEKLGRLRLPFAKVRAIRIADVDGEADDGGEDGAAGKAGAKVEASGPLVRAYLRDGGRLTGRLGSWNSATLELVHADLGIISLRTSAIEQLGFLGGRCQFLSDLEPRSVRENLGPLFVAKLPYRRDANVLGGPLRMAGRVYPKGLGVHAYSRLEFDLSRSFERFQATIGLDEVARPRGIRGARRAAGSVVFRVFVDGKRLLEEPLTFESVPKSIDIDVSAGASLVLEVDFEKQGLQMALDRANWASARLIRARN